MSFLINLVRKKINDPAGAGQQFDNLTIQEALDQYRNDVYQEPLQPAPSFINISGSSQAQYVWADFYSRFGFWERDVVIQGNNVTTHAPWIVLTPLEADYTVGKFSFELDVYNTGVAPGQYPPVWATGRVYDIWAASADLLDMWSATVALNFDFTSDGQSFRASQMATALQNLANRYRMQAKPRAAKMVRKDVNPDMRNLTYNLLNDSKGY